MCSVAAALFPKKAAIERNRILASFAPLGKTLYIVKHQQLPYPEPSLD